MSDAPTSPIPVAVLGATGMVGQRMVQLLDGHPWFQVAALTASERSAGRPYADAAAWRLTGRAPASVAAMPVRSTDPHGLPGGLRIAFSALDGGVARPMEEAFREAGWLVISNASAFRSDPDVPLVIPEVNPHHVALLDRRPGQGGILTNPNCCAIPLAMVLAPLQARWPVQALTVATWQAVSGAGYPGESAWDMIGSVHPHPGDEEQKLASEPLKILGLPGTPLQFPISARCVRVPVADGHLLGMHLRLQGDPDPDEVAHALAGWTGNGPDLPSSPRPLSVVDDRRDRPATRFDVDQGGGMAITVGRVERCAVMGVKLYALAHNTIRGAAGAAIANAELLVRLGRV